ncbi:MAG: hypothetical protein NWR96_05465 [Crocinitomicaceae bacterium]|jgi:hypothetical protein|nr:hypothetical protein [Crocinitomicaceae bacterium]
MKALHVMLISIGLFFVSCADLKKDDQMKRIGQLKQRIDQIEQKRKANEIDTLMAMKVSTNAVEIRIKTYLILDTINLVLGKKMDAYKIMRRNLKPLGKQNSQLKNALKEEAQVLKSLKLDINNGSGSREKYESYILFEKNKINQIQVLLDEYLKLKRETLKTYHELHPELNQFSIELIRKNNLQQQ